MLIEKTVGYRVGDVFRASLEDAQSVALEAITSECAEITSPHQALAVAKFMVKKREEIISILSMKGPKQRKPRSDRGVPRRIVAMAPDGSEVVVATSATLPKPKGTKIEGSGKYAGR